MSDAACPQGSRILGLEYVFWVTGENFGGGTARSSELMLTYSNP